MDKKIKKICKLTPMQEGMLFHRLADEDSTSYHNQKVIWLDEKMDYTALRHASKILIMKHEALTAAFVVPQATGIPRQVFFEDRDLECSRLEVETEDEEAYIEFLKNEDLKRGFHLQNESLFRLKLIDFTNSKRSLLLFSHHHIIMDGWCMSLVSGDLMRYYSMLSEGMSYKDVHQIASEEKKRTSKYFDYLKWLDERDRNEALIYWNKLLGDYDNTADIIPVNAINESNDSVEVISISLQDAEIKAIKEGAIANRTTMNTLFEATWGLVLQKYNYVKDVVFGKVVSGRNVPIRGIEETVGLFINTIPCRVKLEEGMSISDLLQSLQKQASRSNNHDHCPLVEIQKETKQKSDLIKTLMVYENADNYDEMNINEESTRESTNYDVNFGVSIDRGKILCRLIYNPKRYAKSEMDMLLVRIKKIALFIANNPLAMCHEIDFITEDEEKIIKEVFNNIHEDSIEHLTLSNLFEKQVSKRPNKIGIVFEERSLTYLELNQRANAIALKLRHLGIEKGDKVALITDRGLEAIIGVLGIVKAGAAYVPIDSAYPEERIRFVLKDCDPKALLVYGYDIKSSVPTIDLSQEEEALQDNPKIINEVNDLAYVMYTSGTVGQPKGVMITQKNIITLIQDADYIPINSETVLLQTGKLAFDASTFEIWGALLNGGQLHLSKEEAVLEISKLKQYIATRGINTMFFTTALFNQIVSEDVTVFDALKYLTFGGEKASESHVSQLREHNKELDLRNVYGPTECTTFATYFKITEDLAKIPIGKPRVKTQTYVMADNKLCGVGILGELCIAGDGVSCGYLNRDQLTKEKFISNPFGKGKLYRTGDLVKWQSDGNIQFVGRRDQQVKIRGFRIELGDIESAIRKVERVKDVVVIHKKNNIGQVFLQAFVVGEEPLECSDIKEEIRRILPDYMVPKHMMLIPRIPVNDNGKVNKRALPEITCESKSNYVCPRNEIEESLVKIFEEVLGIKKVSVIDNFFELGGDSIKAIRISSKLRGQNYEVTIKDIMQGHTIEKIAKRAKKVNANSYQQGEVTGEVFSTPIMNTFFSKDLANPSHYNQSVLFRIKSDDVKVMEKVLNAITKHHDLLRSVKKNKTLVVLPFTENKGYDLCVLDFLGEEQIKEKVEKACTTLQGSISLEEGPLMKTALIRTDVGNFFFMAIHHLVIDGVSWRILMEDIHKALEQINEKRKISFQPKTSSFINWSKDLNEYKKTKDLADEKAYWQSVIANMEDEFTEQYEVEDEYSIDEITADLDRQKTQLLLRECHMAFNTQIDDIFLAALTKCVATVLKKKTFTVGLEGHGREAIHKNLDISRTVGWFTTLYPVQLRDYENARDNIIQTKETLRKIPNKGLGYGLLESVIGGKEISITFNYLGDMDAENKSDKTPVPFSSGLEVSPENEDIKLAVDCMIINQQLRISIRYNKKYIQSETAKCFIEEYKKCIGKIIDYCVSRHERVKTLSDLTGKIQMRDKEIINTQYSDEAIEDIYELTPLQEGMFYYSEVDKTSTVYIIQNLFKINGSLNIDAFKKAIDMVKMENEVLRTVFLYKKLSAPLQVVLKEHNIEMEILDMSNCSDSIIDHEVEQLVHQDLNRGFDFEKDSLMRIKILQLDSYKYKILFTLHHVIIDGWSLSILLGDIFKYYAKLSDARSLKELKHPPVLPKHQVGKYSDYISWIQKQDINKGMGYWEKLLSDYEEIGEIRPLNPANQPEIQMQRQKSTFTVSETNSILQLGRELKVTSNTIVEALWGIVLQKYNYINDVVFGKVVSGRNADVPDIESMVGMFINTIPVRVTAKDNSKVVDLLKAVQLQADESFNHCHYSLSNIQDKTGLGNQLIKSIVVFENYYTDDHKEEAHSEFEVELDYYREQLNYPISLLVSMENHMLDFSCLYNPNEYGEVEIQLLLKRLKRILLQMVSSPNMEVNDIEILLEQDQKLLLQEFNDTHIEYDQSLLLMDYFEERVKKIPNHIAVVFEDRVISYQELNAKANKLAWKLREAGIGPDDFVGIMAVHGIEMIVGLIGILKSGGAYVPIDHTYPDERKQYILKDCKARVVVTYGIDEEVDLDNAVKITLEDCLKDENGNTCNPPRNNKPCHLAYCLYTSGTTGKPKGVMVEQRSLVNYVHNNPLSVMEEAYKNNYKRVLSVTNFTFDIFFTETILVLVNGMTIYMSNEEERRLALPFSQLCKRHQVEVLQTTPSRIASLLGDHRSHKGFKTLKFIIIGGEKLEESIVNLLAKQTDATILNVYGPTEATVWATGYLVDPKKMSKNIPIGRPLANTKIYILNKTKLCDRGMTGELCIGGHVLARGYLNNEEETNEKFIENPYGEGLLYRTGDIAKWNLNGEIIFEGRIDDQVKLNGLRIELGEIDSVLRRIPTMRDCAVIVRKNGTEENALCAYLVADHKINIQQIREQLKKELHEYMVPQYIQQISKLPMTTSGKLDRKALPLIDMTLGKSYVPPKNDIEKHLCNAFKEVLNVKRVSRLDSFYELGGNSLKAIRVLSKMEERGYNITLQDLMSKETVAKICSGVDSLSIQERNRYIENLYDPNYVISKKKKYTSLRKEELIQSTRDKMRKYEKEVLTNAECVEYPLTGIQRISYKMGVRKLAMQISFYEEVDLHRLNQSWSRFQCMYDTLKSCIVVGGEVEKIQLLKGKESAIPFVDISMLDEEDKRQYLLALVEEADSFDQDMAYLGENLSHKVVLVKLGTKAYSLFIACSHLIADGYSSEIIKNRLMEVYHKINKDFKLLSYESSYKLLANESMLVQEADVKDFMELESFEKTCKTFNEFNRIKEHENCFYEYQSKDWSMITQEEKLAITQKVFIKALQYSYPQCDIPICILRMCRSNSEFGLHNYVGEFLDLVPLIIPTDYSGTVEEMSEDKIAYCERNNVFLSSMLYPKEATSPLGTNEENLSKMIIYNNRGILGNTEHMLGERRFNQAGNVMDIDINKEGFSMNLYVEGNKKKGIKSFLDTYVSEMILEKCYIEDSVRSLSALGQAN